MSSYLAVFIIECVPSQQQLKRTLFTIQMYARHLQTPEIREFKLSCNHLQSIC